MHARHRTDHRIRMNYYIRRREYDMKHGKAARALSSLLNKHKPPYVLETMHIPGNTIHPTPPHLIHSYVTNAFARSFSQPEQPDTEPVDLPHGGLSWDQVQDWPTFHKHYAHLEQQGLPLHTFWKGLTMVKRRNRVHNDLSSLWSKPPTFSRFMTELKRKKGGSTGGFTGLTYELIKAWPESTLRMVHKLLSQAWMSRSTLEYWNWKWLVPIPKVPDPNVDQIRPIMLLESLRKLWTSIIIKDIHQALLRHRILHPAQHGFQPRHGTDTANIQVINVLEEAKANRSPVYGSSWDMKKAFDSISKPIIRLAWLRVGVPADVVEWLMALDADSSTVVRSAFATQLWDEGGRGNIDPRHTFNPELGIGQGDVSSPLTWVVVFDILLCGLARVDPSGLFRLKSRSGSWYCAPDVAYADDLVSFASTLLGLQAKADLVTIAAKILGLTIALPKLRLYRKRWDWSATQATEHPELLTINRSLPSETKLTVADLPYVKQLGVLYDLDCSGITQFRHSLMQFRTSINAISWKKASPEAILYALEASSSNQIAYHGVLSNWSRTQTLQFDSILATELRRRSKNLQTSQLDHLFQPAKHGGLGFHRVSSIIHERKKGLIDRALQSDFYTRRAMEQMIARAGVEWSQGHCSGPIDSYRTGWWISGVVEHGAAAARALFRPAPTTLDLNASIYQWLGLSTSSRKLCQHAGLTVVGDLTEIVQDTRCWAHWALNANYLREYLLQHQPPTGAIYLAIGQLWQPTHTFAPPPYILEVVSFSAPDLIWCQKWWTLPAKRHSKLQIGQLLYRKSTDVTPHTYLSLFPTPNHYRQLYLDPPSSTKHAHSIRITRKLLSWKHETRPILPLHLSPATPTALTLRHPSPLPHVPLTSPTSYHIFIAQHRTHPDPWTAALCENPKELIWGSVVTLQISPDGTETWTAHRFTYTPDSGHTFPTPYMIYTLLAYWAVTSSLPSPPRIRPCTSTPHHTVLYTSSNQPPPPSECATLNKAS